MNTVGFLFAFLLCGWSRLFGGENLVFLGEDFKRQSDTREALSVVFIPTDEEMISWTKLLYIEKHAKGTTIENAISNWATSLRLIQTPGASLKERVSDIDRTAGKFFTLTIRPPGDGYLELSEIRFFESSGGSVFTCRYTRRVDPTSVEELMNCFKGTDDVVQELARLSPDSWHWFPSGKIDV